MRQNDFAKTCEYEDALSLNPICQADWFANFSKFLTIEISELSGTA